ncbi:hypothetical protein D3C84_1160360 [compost metagenome]
MMLAAVLGGTTEAVEHGDLGQAIIAGGQLVILAFLPGQFFAGAGVLQHGAIEQGLQLVVGLVLDGGGGDTEGGQFLLEGHGCAL